MAKKIKPVSINDTEITVDTPVESVDTTVTAKAIKTNIDTPITADDILDSKVSADDTIAGLEKANANLTAENESLKDKIVDYINEIAELKKKLDAKTTTKDSDATLKELKTLREENDSYLMKISELTFENAKLKTKRNSAAKSSLPPSHREVKNTANPIRQGMNGYNDWN